MVAPLALIFIEFLKMVKISLKQVYAFRMSLGWPINRPIELMC